MTIPELLKRCDDADIELWADGVELRYRGDADLLTPDALDVLRKHKLDILAMLAAPADRAKCLALAGDRAYPRIFLRPGESVMPEHSAWERFTSNATIADVRAVLSQLERLDSQPLRIQP